MKKTWNILFLGVAIFIIIKTFLDNETTHSVIGYEMNIWAYRAIWLFIGVMAFLRAFIFKAEEK